MNRASIFQVAHHVDVQILQRALSLVDGVEVEHRLRWVEVATVSSVDNRNMSHLARIQSCSFQLVAHHDDIGIVRNHLDGIFQRFTLRRTGHLWICESYDTSAQTVGSCFKTQTSASGRLEKQGCHHFPLQKTTIGCLLKF